FEHRVNRVGGVLDEIPQHGEVRCREVDQGYLVSQRVVLRLRAEAGRGEDRVAVAVARPRPAGARSGERGGLALVYVVDHTVPVADGGQTNWGSGQILCLDEQADGQGERRDVPELSERVDLVPGTASADQQAVLVLLQDLPRLLVLVVVGREDL